MPEDQTMPEEAIRHRAHALWEDAGRPEGRDEEFAGETGAAPLPEPAKAKPRAAKAPAKAKPRAKKT